MIMGIFIIYILFILGTFILLRNKMKPLFKMTNQAQKVTEGDLTVEDLAINDKSKDEITILAKAFNLMTQSLRNVLTTVSKISNEVAAASEELLANAEQTNIQQSGTSLSNVTASIQQVAAAAENVSTISTDAHKQAKSDQKDVQNTVLYMQEIEKSVDDMLVSIKSLSEHSTNIETFVSAITDISDQTNLLALNAAIEAARAGEVGKGFAVVADEVRQLAEQSNESANKITLIIDALQKEMRETATQMEKVTTQVKNGVQTVNLTGKTFNDIQQATSIVAEQIKSVASITNQMTSSATQTNATSEQLEITAVESATNAQGSVALVEEQYASMEEITAAANMLTQLANNLNEENSKFNV
ncbi:methyl-accepting chemotaxis protein [Candidatus Kurthia intestinigallinarum]